MRLFIAHTYSLLHDASVVIRGRTWTLVYTAQHKKANLISKLLCPVNQEAHRTPNSAQLQFQRLTGL